MLVAMLGIGAAIYALAYVALIQRVSGGPVGITKPPGGSMRVIMRARPAFRLFDEGDRRPLVLFGPMLWLDCHVQKEIPEMTLPLQSGDTHGNLNIELSISILKGCKHIKRSLSSSNGFCQVPQVPFSRFVVLCHILQVDGGELSTERHMHG